MSAANPDISRSPNSENLQYVARTIMPSAFRVRGMRRESGRCDPRHHLRHLPCQCPAKPAVYSFPALLRLLACREGAFSNQQQPVQVVVSQSHTGGFDRDMGSRSPRRVSLQLPPELESSWPTPERGPSSMLPKLLPRALEKLGKLGSVPTLKLRNVVGKGEGGGTLPPPLELGLATTTIILL